MRYMGSKARHAKEIVPILMKGHDPSSWYFEPFVGGGNLFSQVPAKLKYGSDVAEYAVALLEALSKGWEPPEVITELEYHQVKANPQSYDPAYVGFVAYCCSYSGKFWGGYARGNDNKGKARNFASEQARNLKKQRVGLFGAEFGVHDYKDLVVPAGSTVYCDPPYLGTTGYQSKFNHDSFWAWCENLSYKGCRVFVSEYKAPSKWDCVWEKTVTSSLTKNTGGKKGTEKLFRVTTT